MFKENLSKKGPLFRDVLGPKPNHMGGPYPYPQNVMYPLGGLKLHKIYLFRNRTDKTLLEEMACLF